MSNIIELSTGDYGFSVQVTLYKSDDSATAENLTSVSSITLDITRLDETPIVNDAEVTITDAGSGVVNFTPLNTWFTTTTVGSRSHYVGIFKLNYASGVKHSFKIPIYVHRH